VVTDQVEELEEVAEEVLPDERVVRRRHRQPDNPAHVA
jgi:hypothetical protein